MDQRRRGIGLWILILGLLLVSVFFSEGLRLFGPGSYSYQEFVKDFDTTENTIEKIVISPNKEVPTGLITVEYEDGDDKSFYVTNVEEVKGFLTDHGFTAFEETDVINREGWFYKNGALLILGGVFLWFLFSFINGQQNAAGGNGRMMDFGKSHAKLSDNTRVTFKDVAGLKEEKEELQEIVDFLRDPDKFTRVGARIPKGVILTGSPGTGKTLLAKAVAGEAGVPFFTISGSDFVEMFVGVGASRVRDLFETAKKNKPCIIFIDEIDAVARRRGTGLGGGHDEREQTLNQLLVEMDGFTANEGIIVMAATNRADILDPAILRPGRFDRKVGVSKPDIEGRRDILRVHSRNKPLGDDVDLDQIARTTAGFTGADLENLMNEAAIYAAKGQREYIVQDDIRRAFVKVAIGARRRAVLSRIKRRRLRLTTSPDMRFCSMYFRMSDRYIRFPLFRPVWGLQAIRCRFRKRMICSIQRGR